MYGNKKCENNLTELFWFPFMFYLVHVESKKYMTETKIVDWNWQEKKYCWLKMTRKEILSILINNSTGRFSLHCNNLLLRSYNNYLASKSTYCRISVKTGTHLNGIRDVDGMVKKSHVPYKPLHKIKSSSKVHNLDHKKNERQQLFGAQRHKKKTISILL